MDTLLEWIQQNLLLTIIGAATMVQIVPIKINPWSWVGQQIKTGIGITDIQKELEVVKKDIQQDRVTNWRWNILDFGNSCRNGRKHSKDEWDHLIDQVTKYDKYCQKNNIENGVIEEESRYLRTLYQERLTKNDFL